MKNAQDFYNLKRDHQYYFQVQTQLYVCDKRYCDFVVWGEESFIHIERVLPDKNW